MGDDLNNLVESLLVTLMVLFMISNIRLEVRKAFNLQFTWVQHMKNLRTNRIVIFY